MKMKCNVFHAYLALKNAAVYDVNVGIINVVHARQLRLSIIVVLAQLGIFKGGWVVCCFCCCHWSYYRQPTDVSTHCIAVFVLDVASTCFVFLSFSFVCVCSFVSSAVCSLRYPLNPRSYWMRTYRIKKENKNQAYGREKKRSFDALKSSQHSKRVMCVHVLCVAVVIVVILCTFYFRIIHIHSFYFSFYGSHFHSCTVTLHVKCKYMFLMYSIRAVFMSWQNI